MRAALLPLLLGAAWSGAAGEVQPQARSPVSFRDTGPGATEACRCLIELDEAGSDARLLLLEAIRVGVRQGAAESHAARVEALRAFDEPGQQELERSVQDMNGRVLRRFLCWPGALVELPPAAAGAWPTRHPDRWPLRPERAWAPHVKVATDANNHAADHVQNVLGLRGAGATLALFDTGADLDCNGSGNPHPHLGGTLPGGGSRLVAVRGAFGAQDVEDQQGHGTWVGSIALGRNWAGSASTFSDDGFAPDAGLVSLKITSGTQFQYFDSSLLAMVDEVALQRLAWDVGVANVSWAGSPSPAWPTSQALDVLAFYFDVVVVTSAGNGGLDPTPTIQSFANCNGLAVGAIHPDSHAIWTGSTFGPLLGDPLRRFPDLTAVGTEVRTATVDSPQGVSPVLNGTSFAAPMVAGTALLLRGADPSLSALDARGLLLNSTADLAQANPDRTRWHWGRGMLRTDLAVEHLQTGTVTQAILRSGDPALLLPIQAIAGKSYSATIAWPRLDPSSTDWDDLDLELRDPNGRLIAASTSTRDLDERVLFDARLTGPHELRVIPRRIISPTGVLVSIAHAEHRGGGKQPGTWQLDPAVPHSGCPGQGVVPIAGLEVPAFTAGGFASRGSIYPFAGPPCRLLMVLDHNEVPPGTVIRHVALRRDENSFGYPSYDADVELRMGLTSRPAGSPLATFDANYDLAGPTVVTQRRWLTIPGDQEIPADYDVFDVVLPLDQPYTVQTGPGRNLVIEFVVHGHSRGSIPFGLTFDAELNPFEAVTISTGSATAATGVLDVLTPPLALLRGDLATAVPRLFTDGLPQLGGTFALHFARAAPNAPGVLIQGFPLSTWGSASIPFDLTALGAPGCALHARPDAVVALCADGAGRGSLPIQVPADPAFTGQEYRQQLLFLDQAANGLGISATRAVALRVGG